MNKHTPLWLNNLRHPAMKSQSYNNKPFQDEILDEGGWSEMFETHWMQGWCAEMADAVCLVDDDTTGNVSKQRAMCRVSNEFTFFLYATIQGP